MTVSNSTALDLKVAGMTLLNVTQRLAKHMTASIVCRRGCTHDVSGRSCWVPAGK